MFHSWAVSLISVGLGFWKPKSGHIMIFLIFVWGKEREREKKKENTGWRRGGERDRKNTS